MQFRAFGTIALSLLMFCVLASLIFRTPPTAYTGVSRASSAPFAPNAIRVASRSPAYRAGLRSGDILACLSVRDKELLFPRFGFQAYAPQMVIRGCAFRSDKWRAFVLTPVAHATVGLLYFSISSTIVRLVVYLVFLLTGIALVLARPTLLTWLFYVYCLGSGPFYVFSTLGVLWPAWTYAILLPFQDAITAAGVVCLALFALCVPNDGVPHGWRRSAFVAVCIAGLIPISNYIGFALWTSANVPRQFFDVLDEVFTAAAFVIVLARLFEVRGEERARLSWVAFALVWGVITNDIRNSVGALGTAWYLISFIAADLTVVMPLLILYAILKRHIIDVRFVISRTVVYTCLTTIVVGVIGAVDWVTSAYLSQVRFAMAIDAAVTIGLAFVLHRVYQWVEGAVEFVLFRHRHEAERYLERVARSLMFAEREEAVDTALVQDPYDKLRLTAAAVYRPCDGGYFAACVAGWSADTAPRFRGGDDLLRFMAAERCKIALGDLRAHVAEPFRLQGHVPAVAIPLFQGNRLTSFALYGIHRDGTKLDPDEVQTLERLCAAAAQAYTGIELERYQRAPVAALNPLPT